MVEGFGIRSKGEAFITSDERTGSVLDPCLKGSGCFPKGGKMKLL